MLTHPIIDADGHLVECPPVLLDFLKQVGGSRLAERFVKRMSDGAWGDWRQLTQEERRARGVVRRPFWNMTSNSLDRATALLPDLLRSRLDEFGIDYQILYPSVGIPFISGSIDAELRAAMCRALNLMYAEIFSGHETRITPAATIPTHTPKEALDEIDFAIGELGLKTAMIAGTVQRPLKAIAELDPELGQYAYWIDPLALDSDYDYDPVWRRFVEVGVAPATHNNSVGWGARRSSSNYVYNHIGHFAAAAEAFSKALLLGGVVRRFPTLRFAFLEGGCGWAANLYNDLHEHFEKRNVEALRRNLNPVNVDHAAIRRYFETCGSERFRAAASEVEKGWDSAIQPPGGDEPEPSDDFLKSGIRNGADIAHAFSDNFFFGCEADDRMTAVAFDSRMHHEGIKLRAVLGSDIGHWDVPDMSHVIAEAYELVESGLLTDQDFRAFTFSNVAELHSSMNKQFFDGTVVHEPVAQLNLQPAI